MGPTDCNQEPDFEALATQAYRLCLALLRHEADAAEAAQEALLRAWQARARRRQEVKWATWVGGFAVRVCREARRRRPHSVDDSTILESVSSSGVHPGRLSDLAGRLHEAIAALPDRQREVVTLRWLLGYSTACAARMLDCPEGTIKSNLHKAVGRLREVLPAGAAGHVVRYDAK